MLHRLVIIFELFQTKVISSSRLIPCTIMVRRALCLLAGCLSSVAGTSLLWDQLHFAVIVDTRKHPRAILQQSPHRLLSISRH